MELLDLPQLAERAGLPLSLARYYRDRFIMFVPSVRVGRTVLHPCEAIEVLRIITDQARAGANSSAIEAALEQAFPVTVITSQEVSGDGEIAGASGVIARLAQTLDDRGARVETELHEIRARMETLSIAPESHGADAAIPAPPAGSGDWTADLTQLKYMLEDILTRQSSLASHEQLEWIGDVVSAAVLRPSEPGSRDAIDRKLSEIQDELRTPRPPADVAELRIAVEQLTEHVQARDESYHRVLQSLVGAMRSEIASLHSSIKETRRPNGGDIVPMPLLLTAHREEIGRLDVGPGEHAASDPPGADNGKSRSPRRLGQPTRPPEAHGAEPSPDHGTD